MIDIYDISQWLYKRIVVDEILAVCLSGKQVQLMIFRCSFPHDVNLLVEMTVNMIIGTQGIEKTRNNKAMERSLAENDNFSNLLR